MKTIVDIIILVCFLGSFVFILSDVLLYYLLKPRKKQKRIVYCILHNLITIILSFFIFAIWNFETDVISYFIFLPAVLAEIIVIPLFYYWINNRK